MGLGADLMRFFAKEQLSSTNGKLVGRSMEEFSTEHAERHPHPALNLAAAQRLCEVGRLIQLGTAVAAPLFGNRYGVLKTTAELQPELDYGTFDFLVDGFPAVLDQFENSVFQLIGTNSATGDPVAGTAFLVAHRRLVMTAKHCVHGIEDLSIRVGDGETEISMGESPLSMEHGDLAIFLLDEEVPARPFQLAEVTLLEPVLTMGYPKLAGLLPTLLASSGEVAGSATNYLDGQHEYVVTTCAMTGGSSGGPVVQRDGKVLAVVSEFSKTDAGLDPARFGLGSPAMQLRPAVAALLAAIISPNQEEEIVAALEAGMFPTLP